METIHVSELFWVNLDMTHPSCGPDRITEELGLLPWRTRQSAQLENQRQSKFGIWKCRYREGRSNEDFSSALEDVIKLCLDHDTFLREFVNGGGRISVSINRNVAWDDGVLFELSLSPLLLRVLSTYEISLQVQAWSTQAQVYEGVA